MKTSLIHTAGAIATQYGFLFAVWPTLVKKSVHLASAIILMLTPVSVLCADIYQLDDGTVDTAVGVVGGVTYDMIWLNRFDRQAGFERITHLSAAFGAPLVSVSTDGLPVTLLVYNDADGGSVTNATVAMSFDTTISNSNTGLVNVYDIPDIVVTEQFLVAALVHNFPEGSFPAAFDWDLPNYSNASFLGFTSGSPLDPYNLTGLGNFQNFEDYGYPGNWFLRATGAAIPEPAVSGIGIVLLGLLVANRRQKLNSASSGAVCHEKECVLGHCVN